MAVTANDFCSCTDVQCPLNPVNHDSGCDLCINKNLGLKELPVCFFKKATNDPHATDQGSSFEHFAKIVLSQKKKVDD
jgi:hypothetical protein